MVVVVVLMMVDHKLSNHMYPCMLLDMALHGGGMGGWVFERPAGVAGIPTNIALIVRLGCLCVYVCVRLERAAHVNTNC